MSEVSGDFVYPGGDMTPEEFMAAEFEVDEEFERFKTDGVPYFDVAFNGLKRRLHPFNTSVIRYDTEGGNMHDHVLHQANGGEYVFYNEIEGGEKLANKLLERDFPLTLHYSEPHPNVKEKLYQCMRGKEPIDDITGRILGE